MSNADEALSGIRGMVEANLTDDGVDVINVYSDLINVLKSDPSTDTIEAWELAKIGISNGALIACSLIDKEIARLKGETHGLS